VAADDYLVEHHSTVGPGHFSSEAWIMSPARNKNNRRTGKSSRVQTNAAIGSLALPNSFGTLVCVDHPELATRSQNILLDGTYLASFPLGQRGTSKNSL